MKMKIFFVLLLSALHALNGVAQQDPIYAQYLGNPIVINPAFTAIDDRFNAGIQYRTQWTGLAGNPVSMNFNSNISLVNNKVGAGILVIQDQIGETKTTEFNTAYSYKIKLKNSTFSFGLQAGFVRYSNDPSKLNVRDPTDPNFAFFNEMKFNTGAGLLLKSDRYVIGFSVPRLLPSTIGVGGQSMKIYDRNYYLMTAYQVFLTDRVRLRPSVLLRGSSGSPLSADLNLSVNIENLYLAGLFTRNFNTYGVLLQMIVKFYRIGYVFELPAGSASSLRYTSHEIMLSISPSLLSFHNREKLKFYP